MLWQTGPRPLSCLSPGDQLALHKYYLFALDKIEAELISHRRNVHIGDPSLPQRAGRAYAKLLRGERSSVGTVTTSTGRVISVRPLMRPEPNLELLAKAFMQMAIREVQEQAIEQQKVRKRALRSSLAT